MASGTAPADGAEGRVLYLADHRELIIFLQQGWGVLGINTAAHAPNREPSRLRIKDREYDRGLGHHAPGVIVIELDGAFEAFEADVGVQWQGHNVGTVVFRVLVDGEVKFDSGVMHEADPPRQVRVDLAGAQELVLESGDAGDGIICDVADWAEARLIRAENPVPLDPTRFLDVAAFARVVTCDPHRTDGARSTRTQEFRAEDVFLETELAPDPDGVYQVPVSDDGVACVGLVWMERRLLREVALELAPGAKLPPAASVRVEYWEGESPWQGQWKPLAGRVVAEGAVLRLVRAGENLPGAWPRTWKIRWLLPAPGPLVGVKSFAARSLSLADTLPVTLQLERPQPGKSARVEMYNGELAVEGKAALGKASGAGAAQRSLVCDWELSAPLHLQVRYARPRAYYKSDRTLLLIHLPWASFGIAVEDLLTHDCVYVPDAGLFATREPAPITLAEYRRSIADRHTILDRVRHRPEQTFARAMAAVHRPVQDRGPMLLSLACDNHKFIVQREGAIEYSGFTVTPTFGSVDLQGLIRHLDGDCLPMPVIEVTRGPITYRQRAFVAPFGPAPEDEGDPLLGRRSLGVVEFTVENTSDEAAPASLRLAFATHGDQAPPVSLRLVPEGALATKGEQLGARVVADRVGPLQLTADGTSLLLSGTLPAHAAAHLQVYLPAWALSPDAYAELPGDEDLAAATERYWRHALAPAMQVEVPEPLLNRVIHAVQVHCLIAARSELAPEPLAGVPESSLFGPRCLIAPWIAAMSYGPLESEANSIIYGMDLFGHADFARHSLLYFVRRYNPAGFLTTGYTLMGTGWHLWTLARHFALDGDEPVLRAMAPEVARVCQWVVRQREKTRRLGPDGRKVPEYGLMPPGVLADWNVFGYFFTLNSHFYAGLHEAADALAQVGWPDAAALQSDAAEFRDDLLRAYRWIQERSPVVPLRDGTWIPFYPSLLYCPGPTEDFYPGEDWGRVWANNVEIGAHHLVPAGVLAPDSRRAEWIASYMEDWPFLRTGMGDYPGEESERDWFNLGGFAKIQPYYCRIAEIYALRGERKPFLRAYFNAIPSLLNTETLYFWEHFHNMGAWDKTHEMGWFLVQTRTMLVMERGDELWLAPFVPGYWLEDGKTVTVRQAPTRFGKVSYWLRSHIKEGYIEARVEFEPRGAGKDGPDSAAASTAGNEPGRADTPRRLVLRIPLPEPSDPSAAPYRLESVTLNDKPHTAFDADAGAVYLPASGGTVVLQAVVK
ncbi:MAG: NPCBM/NEW2 domain-containing protein [Armatimonadetes bacterium]|nr:NPCBM/NEW2 domain-containing protein [Armatimonadota bacterium]